MRLIDREIIEKAAEKFETPLYLYDTDILREEMARFRKALGPDIGINYSMKANSFILETMAELGLEIRPEWIFDCRWDDRVCMEQITAAAEGPGLPRAIYASSDLMAMAALRAMYQLGIRVPEQVAVIGMTDIEMSQYANPPLTTIHVPVEELGKTCAKVLAERIRGDKSLPKRIILPSELVPRDSA